MSKDNKKLIKKLENETSFVEFYYMKSEIIKALGGQSRKEISEVTIPVLSKTESVTFETTVAGGDDTFFISSTGDIEKPNKKKKGGKK